MRSYPRNSPQAAARIVCLALLADGELAPAEIRAIDRLGLTWRLGLQRHELYWVLQELCDDLMATACLSWTETCRVSPEVLASLLTEVDDPVLQSHVLHLCVEIAHADGALVPAESIVLEAARSAWKPRAALRAPLARMPASHGHV